MYILNLDEHKHLTLKSGTSYVGENNADRITCYLPINFKEYDLKDCFVLLHIFSENEDGTSNGNVVQLEIEEELYKGKYVSTFDISRAYTSKVQRIFLKLEILNSDEVVAYTNSVSFAINENKTATMPLPDADIPNFEEFVIRLNEAETKFSDLGLENKADKTYVEELVDKVQVNVETISDNYEKTKGQIDDLDTSMQSLATQHQTDILSVRESITNSQNKHNEEITSVNSQIDENKVNISKLMEDVGDVKTAINAKIDKEDVQSALSQKADKTQTEEMLLTKADKTEVEEALALKADKEQTESALSQKANQEELQQLNAEIEARCSAIETTHNEDIQSVRNTVSYAFAEAIYIEENIIGDENKLQTTAKMLVPAINEVQQEVVDLQGVVGAKADISYVDEAISSAIGEALEGNY